MTTEASQQANRAGMDPKRLVVASGLVAGAVLVMFLSELFAQLLARFGVGDRVLIEGLENSKLSGVLALFAVIGGGTYAWLNQKTRAQAIEVASELMRVTWPSWEETRVSTIAVVVASLVAAVILFGIDSLSYKVMVDWLPYVWGKL